MFDKMILGAGAVFTTDSQSTGLNNNVIVCGGSGSGKTMSVSEPRLLETYNSSLIVTVTKRRIANKYKHVFEKRGYAVEDLNYITPAESDVVYDPLKYIRSYSDITFLARSIVEARPKKEKNTADPYWDSSAVSLLSAEIAYTMMSKRNATFADVLQLHNEMQISDNDNMIATSLDSRFDQLAAKDPTCFAVNCWKTFKQVPIRTGSCIFSSLNTTLDTLFTPELQKTFSMPRKVDFEELARRKTVLFISTSAVNPSLHAFINLFYAQAFKSLFEFAESQPDGALPVPVHVLCDDFATGSRILNFPDYISVFREKGLSVTLLIQSESQLESIYGPEDAVTIINNCDTYLYMGGMDLKTGKHISERLNVPLEDVLYMPIGREFIFRRGSRPIVTERYDVLRDPKYESISRQYELQCMRNAR